MSTILLISSVLPRVRGVLSTRERVALAEFPLMRAPALFLHKSDAVSVKLEVDTHRNKALVFTLPPLLHPLSPHYQFQVVYQSKKFIGGKWEEIRLKR